MMGMDGMDTKQAALLDVVRAARKLAGQQMREGARKGINADGSEIVIKIEMPAETVEVEGEEGKEGPELSPFKKRMKEAGIPFEFEAD
jgi:hypothetical protein